MKDDLNENVLLVQQELSLESDLVVSDHLNKRHFLMESMKTWIISTE